MSGALRLMLVLFVVCALAAGSLAFVNAATKERIAGFAVQERETAMKQVFAAAQDFREVQPGRRWEALSAGAPIGSVFAATVQGYGGPIVTFFGLDSGNALTGVRVISHSETPGLGAKIAEEKFLSQFRGLSAEAVALSRDDPQGRVDAVTAATISSRALTSSLRATIDAYLKGDLK